MKCSVTLPTIRNFFPGNDSSVAFHTDPADPQKNVVRIPTPALIDARPGG